MTSLLNSATSAILFMRDCVSFEKPCIVVRQNHGIMPQTAPLKRTLQRRTNTTREQTGARHRAQVESGGYGAAMWSSRTHISRLANSRKGQIEIVAVKRKLEGRRLKDIRKRNRRGTGQIWSTARAAEDPSTARQTNERSK